MKGSRAKGKTYERKVGRELTRRVGAGDFGEAELLSGPWLGFVDYNGRGFAQPDFVIVGAEAVTIIEAKLTQNISAYDQLDLLYRPLCSRLWRKRPVFMIQVFRHPRFEPDARWVEDLKDVYSLGCNAIYEWHWRG